MKTLPWLSLVLLGVVQAEWSSTCPDFCDCKWISGKKSAICSDQGLRNIPRLSSEIQHLNLSGNPLRSLPKDAFSSIGLAHVQKLYLSSCSIKTVHRSAFDDLGNMIELDLSGNAIENLPPETFTGCIRLQMLYLSRNSLLKIGPGVAFPKLPRLRTLDLSFNKIKDISDKAFLNLQSSVITVNLRGNMLEDLLPEPFMGFKELKSLVLDHNPWRCYCYLRRLRDFVVQAKLITEVPPVCDEPLVHQKKPWSMIDSDQFACKPSIYLPQETVYVQEGANVTISCRVDADPPAQTRWTKTDGGRILHGNMTKIPFSNQVYVVEEEGSYSKWTNLTITKVNEQDLGQYTCVGHNFGATVDRTVMLQFQGTSTQGVIVPVLSKTLTIGIASGIASLVVLILLILLLLCRRRRSRGRPEKPKEIKHNGTVHNHDVGDDMGAYHKVATDSDMEMSTRRTGNGLKESSVDELDLEEKAAEMAMIIQRDSYETYDGYNFGGNGPPPDTSAGSSASNRTAETASVHSDHPPPSYNHHAPLGPAYHPLSSLQAPSPTPSSLRNFPDLIDIQHQLQQMDRPTSSQASYLLSHLLPRSFPPPSPSLASGAPTPEPVVAVDWQHLRPAYVTLPRRPRHSPRWASSTPLQSPVPEESLYDTVGPRRTADGSSRLSLNHSDNESPSPMPVTRLEASPSLAGGVSSSGGYISRGVFNYSTLPRGYSPGGNSARSTPSIPEHVGRRQLPVVREESRGPGDEVPEKIKELRRSGRHDDGLPIEKKLSDRQKKIPPAVPTKKKPMSKEISSLYNGHHHHGGGGSSGETSSESPVDSLLQPSSEHTEESDEIGETSYSPQPLINDRKVPPVPPPKPRKPPRTSPLVLGEDGFEDEGSDGTEV